MPPIIETKNLIKTYQTGQLSNTVLKGVTLEVLGGEFVAIMGRSGAGKSTLMYQMSLLDSPTSGQIFIDGKDVLLLSDRKRTKFRLTKFGYVFQDYALLPELTALENTALPLLMQGSSKKLAYQKASKALSSVGLALRVSNLPSQLSGGEQQRVSIARAIAHEPKILFADEPTANLDSETAKEVLSIFRELNKKGQTIIMVTHERDYGILTDRIITVSDGRIITQQ